jgi:hypothetical protein
MSKIGSLSAKPKTVKISGEEFTLVPISFGERSVLAKVMDSEKSSDKTEAVFDLIKKVLQKSYPDMTDEEFSAISVEYMVPLSKEVLSIHGLKMESEELKKMIAEQKSG